LKMVLFGLVIFTQSCFKLVHLIGYSMPCMYVCMYVCCNLNNWLRVALFRFGSM
jgi:hypothetical protein